MHNSPRKIVAGNWKMHGSLQMLADYVERLSTQQASTKVTTLLFPPVAYLAPLAAELSKTAGTLQIELGAQDLHREAQGAYTGEVSGPMVHDLGGRWVLVGHSERRQYQREDDDLVAAKAAAALGSDLTPVICVGESESQRDAGQAERVVEAQLATVARTLGASGLLSCVVAYEPVWAIGTGRTASAATAQAMHAAIRQQLLAICGDAALQVPLLYGGSVKAGNAAELFAEQDINGGLVGGASLDAEEFAGIIAACDKAGAS